LINDGPVWPAAEQERAVRVPVRVGLSEPEQAEAVFHLSSAAERIRILPELFQ